MLASCSLDRIEEITKEIRAMIEYVTYVVRLHGKRFEVVFDLISSTATVRPVVASDGPTRTVPLDNASAIQIEKLVKDYYDSKL